MSYIRKPAVRHSSDRVNELGLTVRDYEGGMSTLCAGCGHDSITAALVSAAYELSLEPHRIVKLSGIGCSSKTPAYFIAQGHGINSVHGRMPSVATGAIAAHRGLHYVGVSGDGDSLSIGLGQLLHAVRRNVDMVYVIENNGVYGLTKGQFSASADVGSTSKRGEPNQQPPIDPLVAGLAAGAGFVARSFSGDKAQLVPLLKAALRYRGFALVDVLSPCVTFNDHETSTKSYLHIRRHRVEASQADFVPPQQTIEHRSSPGQAQRVQLHDGSELVLRPVAADYDPADRSAAMAYLLEAGRKGEVPTGLLHLDPERTDFHTLAATPAEALRDLDLDALSPGAEALADLMAQYR